MQKKHTNSLLWSLFGIFTTFLLINSCGSTAPDIGENDCPQIEDPQGATVSTVVDASSSTTGGMGGSSSSSSSVGVDPVATSTGSGMQLPQFDVPVNDEIMSRLHGCRKLTYNQLGSFLRSRGVMIPPGTVSDVRTTQVNVFGQTVTLGSIFGGSGAACEMTITDANGTNDPVCGGNEVCFCNQDDKMNQVNRGCLDVGNNSPDAADGYCVSKPATAGYLYFTAKDALGYPKLDSRLGEKEEHSTASAMKLMDIFIQSASQIITNIGDPSKAPACTLNGKNRPMFDPTDGSCVEESVSCLIGTPATDDHMLLCNLLVQKAKVGDAMDLSKKRVVAVATLLSAAHSCQ